MLFSIMYRGPWTCPSRDGGDRHPPPPRHSNTTHGLRNRSSDAAASRHVVPARRGLVASRHTPRGSGGDTASRPSFGLKSTPTNPVPRRWHTPACLGGGCRDPAAVRREDNATRPGDAPAALPDSGASRNRKTRPPARGLKGTRARRLLRRYVALLLATICA